MLSMAFLLQQEARRWLVPAVLPRSGLWLPGNHVWQHDCGQHHHAGDRKFEWHTSWVLQSPKCCYVLTDSPATVFVCVFSWCPSPISLMWWWCPICMGTWWATCVQAWWEGLASCPELIMAMPMLSLKRWVFGSSWSVGHSPLCFFWGMEKAWSMSVWCIVILALFFGVSQATRNTGKSIADRNIANPTAMLLASCMMLDHLK